MSAFLAFLGGPLGKYFDYAVIGIIVALGLTYLVHRHDAAVIDAFKASQAEVVAKQQAADVARVNAAVDQVAAAAAARIQTLSAIRSKINAAPPSSACAGSPPIRAVLDGLRDRAGAGTAPADPAKPAGVRPRAAAPAG